ncbi:hypothetical protein EHP00_504 [Ecytonucleospora hepatopenaei]|uniref:Uncharacterized protein n=1 Tax=Ecytonucleospora hepatopenaei TaxID=646526 RepID=A0A1W0E440_9MICR|nr:hypothetical protein EHP00_504 [Ecytonucleospora hepatopenaei]
MMVVDLYLHLLVAHMIQNTALIKEFKENLKNSFFKFYIIFSIDFEIYNKMIDFRKYFLETKHLCILEKMPIIHNSTKEKLQKIYDDWDEKHTYKTSNNFPIKGLQFFDKILIKYVKCDKNDVKLFIKEVNEVFKLNYEKFKQEGKNNLEISKEQENEEDIPENTHKKRKKLKTDDQVNENDLLNKEEFQQNMIENSNLNIKKLFKSYENDDSSDFSNILKIVENNEESNDVNEYDTFIKRFKPTEEDL